MFVPLLQHECSVVSRCRYKVVIAELQEKLKWVEMYIKAWKDRLIEAKGATT